MASKAATQALQAKERVMQDEIEKFRKLQKGQSAEDDRRWDVSACSLGGII